MSPTPDLRKLKISVNLGPYTLDIYYEWLVDLLRVFVIRFPCLDTLEIILDKWPCNRRLGVVDQRETDLTLDVKRLFGGESVFSLLKNDWGVIIHKWTWRGLANK